MAQVAAILSQIQMSPRAELVVAVEEPLMLTFAVCSGVSPSILAALLAYLFVNKSFIPL